jgi:hypothetical protein
VGCISFSSSLGAEEHAAMAKMLIAKSSFFTMDLSCVDSLLREKSAEH